MHASSMLKAFVAVIAASSSAFAELSVTAPIDTTTCTGGQPCTVSWGDSGTGVSLAQQGLCTVALYTGGAQQQTFLQPIAFPTPVNVATTGSIVFTVDPTVGPNGSDYFIRFSSQNLTNPTSPTNPYLSFSHKFTLAGMSGTFNSTVLGQIASASSATAASTPATSAAAHTTTTPAGSTTHASTSAHATTTTHNAAGMSAGVSGALVAGVAVVAGVVGLF